MKRMDKFLRWGWLIPLILFLGCSSHSAGQIRQRDTKERTYYEDRHEGEFKGFRAEKKRLEVELKRYQEENQGLQREVKLLKRRVAKLEKRNLELEQKYVAVQEEEFSLKVSKLIRGRIIGLSRHSNLVIISPGERDEIGPGVEFGVWRHNKRIGKIIVEKVEKDWSSGYSVKEAEIKPLQTGDAIALKIE